MAKKNNEIPEGVEPGQTVTIVKKTAMGLQEKARIEKLIGSRAENLHNYLTEMKDFAMEANEQVDDQFKDQREALNAELVKMNERRAHMKLQKEKEESAAYIVLDDELARVTNELRMKIEEASRTCRDEKAAVKEEIEAKYKDKTHEVNANIDRIKNELEEINKQSTRTKMLRRVALANSFSALRDSINDSRNRAVEGLYTEAVTSDEAKVHLNMLPDTSAFRQQVTPEKLFRIFESNVETKMIGVKELKCKFCGGTTFNSHNDGDYYCKACGKYNVLDKDLKELVALPSLEQIVESASTVRDIPALNHPQQS